MVFDPNDSQDEAALTDDSSLDSDLEDDEEDEDEDGLEDELESAEEDDSIEQI